MPPSSTQLPPELASRYRVERLLGAGAAGRVLLARDQQLDRSVAIKLLEGSSTLASDSRFRAEAQALSQLHHPHILELYDYGGSEAAYLVLEYVSGGSLLDLVELGPTEPERVLEIGLELLDALELAHRHGILHRDLKPENVLLDAQGRTKIADFGLAKHSRSQVKTATGVVLGTPEYMAPEIFRGKPASPASDLYSWGSLLFTLAEGDLLHHGELPKIVKAACRGDLPPTVDRSPFRQVLRRALDPDPARRPDHRQLAALLEGVKPRDDSTRALRRPSALHSATSGSGTATKLVSSLSSSSAAAAAPEGTSWRRPAMLAVLPLLVMGWLAFGGSSGTGAEPRLPLGSEGRSPRSTLETWTQRLEGLAASDLVQELHSKVYGEPSSEFETYSENHLYPGGERHQFAMANVRLDGLVARKGHPTAAPDTEALEKALGELPFRDEWEADRDQLQGLLADPVVPWSERLRLYRKLEHLAALDAYFSAWDRPRPYRAQEVMHALVPLDVVERYPRIATGKINLDDATDIPRPEVDEAPLPPGTLPTPGSHLLYHWALDSERLLPCLIQNPQKLSEMQRITMGILNSLNLRMGEGVNDVYRDASLILDLGEAPRDRYQALTLRLTLANLLQPDALRVDWNDLRVHFRPVDGLSTRWTYLIVDTPEYEVELQLPPESWRPGRNHLRFRVVSLPGLNHRQGADLIRVDLQVDPR